MSVKIPKIHGYGFFTALTPEDPDTPGATVVYRTEDEQIAHYQAHPGRLVMLSFNRANHWAESAYRAGYRYASKWID